LAVFVWCPGAYFDAPFVVLLLCIFCPGAYSEEPGDFVLLCANAAVVSSTVETVNNVFSMGLSCCRWPCNAVPAAAVPLFPDGRKT
jgi:hypothetical protein